jgi:hypothetical protein
LMTAMPRSSGTPVDEAVKAARLAARIDWAMAGCIAQAKAASQRGGNLPKQIAPQRFA